MGADRDSDLRVEAMGVAAVERLAISEGLSVARPVWDADGIDLLVYRAQPSGAVKAVGVQVKAYSGRAFVVYSKYAGVTVMAYYVNAASDSPEDPPIVYVMTAREAREIAVAYTAAHARSGDSAYDPGRWGQYRWSTIPRALADELDPYRASPAGRRTLRIVCRL